MLFVARSSKNTGRVPKGYMMSDSSKGAACSPLISSAEGSRVRTSQPPEGTARRQASEGSAPDSGPNSIVSSGNSPRLGSSSKIARGSEGSGSAWSSGTLPRAGMMRRGIVSPLPPSATVTRGIGSTWSRGEYPTPTASSYGTSQNEGKVPHNRPTKGVPSLHTWARALWGLPASLPVPPCTHPGACKPALHPPFVEWLMGFPVTWTEIGRSGTQLFLL